MKKTVDQMKSLVKLRLQVRKVGSEYKPAPTAKCNKFYPGKPFA